MSDAERLERKRAWCRANGYDERAAELMLQAQDAVDADILDLLSTQAAQDAIAEGRGYAAKPVNPDYFGKVRVMGDGSFVPVEDDDE